MSDWLHSLDGIRDQVWARLAAGAAARDVVSLATVSDQGKAEVRTVVLRDAEPKAGIVAIYTDLYSSKIKSLQANPHAEILLWDAVMRLQIRLEADVTILTGAKAATLWDAIPDHSRDSYGVTPAPGTVIPGDTAYVKAPDPASFAVLTCRITHIDAVSLAQPHRRAGFSRLGDWSGNWLAP